MHGSTTGHPDPEGMTLMSKIKMRLIPYAGILVAIAAVAGGWTGR